MNTIFVWAPRGLAGERGAISIIDSASLDRLSQYKWWLSPQGYLWTTMDNKAVTVQRFLTNAPEGMVVDHINGNRLDNRLSNLRICTPGQNQMARRKIVAKSGYKGVERHGNRYRARIKLDGLTIRIGSFTGIGEAAMAYDSVACQLFGEFAITNGELK